MTTFFPNPDLQPEEIEQFDFGAEVQLAQSLSLKADIFESEVENFMVMSFVARSEVPADAFDFGHHDAAYQPHVVPPSSQPEDQVLLQTRNHPDRARIRGGELELRWNSQKRWTGWINWSYQDIETLDQIADERAGDLELTYAPEHKLNLAAYFGPYAGFHGSFEVMWRDEAVAPSFWSLVGSDFTDPTPVVLDSYTLVNLKLTYELPFGASNASVSVYGKNLPRRGVHRDPDRNEQRHGRSAGLRRVEVQILSLDSRPDAYCADSSAARSFSSLNSRNLSRRFW